MSYNPIPPGITTVEINLIKTAVNAAITQVQTVNNTNVALTTEERQFGVTVGDERKPFTDYYYANKNNYPDLKPGQQKVTEAQADAHYVIHTGLDEVVGLTRTLMELITDVQLNSEHFSFDFASAGRDAAKEGKKNSLPGADSFFDALDDLYPDMGPDPNDTNP